MSRFETILKSVLILGLSFLVTTSLGAQDCGNVKTVMSDYRVISDIVQDSAGNVFVSSGIRGSAVLKRSADGNKSSFITDLDGVGGLTFGNEGHLHVAEYGTGMIKKYNAAGELIDEWDSGLTGPVGLVFDSDGNLYITEWGEMSGTGSRLGMINNEGKASVLVSGNQLNAPVGIDIDEHGNIYVANGQDSKVFKYTQEGEFILIADGGEDNTFGWMAYLDGALYTSNYGKHSIFKIDISDGTVGKFAGTGQGNSRNGNLEEASFHGPNGVSANYSRDALFVTDANSQQLRKITLCTTPTDVKDEDSKPDTIQLEFNYPNPLNPNIQIPVNILRPGYTVIKAFDNVSGREVHTLVEQQMPAGTRSYTSDGTGLPAEIHLSTKSGP